MNIVDHIRETRDVTRDELESILTTNDKESIEYLRRAARAEADAIYGNKIFMRGLVELSSYCKNDCLYCGLRRSNKEAVRYRLTEEEIYECCETGHSLGFRTFVLQGGEDAWFNDERMCRIVGTIRERYPDCAITLSLGERSRESYQALYDAGANRYLLRHETADAEHYARLHPVELSWQHRMDCLQALKEIGYQVGCGFMVGSPYQTIDTLYRLARALGIPIYKLIDIDGDMDNISDNAYKIQKSLSDLTPDQQAHVAELIDEIVDLIK